MAPSASNPWTTDPDYIDLLNYVIQKTKDVKSPINIKQLIKGFKKTSGASQTENCLQKRIISTRARICSFDHIDRKTKAKLLFALSAPVDADFLEELKKDAVVQVDENKRIKKYEAIDGSLKFNGDHSSSAKMRTVMFDCKYSLRTLIINYFKTKDKADVIPTSEEEKEMKNLIEFITGKCENVNSPLNIRQLTNDFNKTFGIARSLETIRSRIRSYCREIQKVEFLDTGLKVKQLFVLSATVDSDYLDKLRKDASVKVDGMNRIINYKAKDGNLELRGEHSRSTKYKNAQLRNFIQNYYLNKNDADAVPENEEEKEMGNLIEFITEKCENVNSPLNISQLTRDFNRHFEITRTLMCIYKRIKVYCREIQNIEFMDTHSEVKQLFGLSAKLSLEHLEKLRKTAVVEVDQENRIIKYTANDGSLTLRGRHWGSKKAKPRRVKKTNKDNVADNSQEESDQEGLNDSSDEYSSGEFDSEFDSDTENGDLDKTKDLTDDEKDDPKTSGNAAVKTQRFKMAPPISNSWTTDPDYIDLLNYIIQKTKDAKSPINVQQLIRDFKEKSGAVQSENCIQKRIKRMRTRICSFEHIDKESKVKLLFALSAPVEADFLEELKKDAVVEIDDEKRITKYEANDKSLELTGNQSRSAKMRRVTLEGKHSLRTLVINYFETKDDPNAVPNNKEEKEWWNLIEFITEKCENVNSPLNIGQLTQDFNKKLGIARSSATIQSRIKSYCREIQTLEYLGTHSKVKQLFCLSMKLNSDCLEKLRKTAVIEVDQKNRIIRYLSNNGSLTLRGCHWGSGNRIPRRVEKRNKNNAAAISNNSEEESDHEGLDDSSDEYSVKNSAANSSLEDNDLLDEPEDLTKPSNEADNLDNNTPIRNRSPSEISIGDNIDFDPPTERSDVSEETEMRKDDSEITENASVKTRYGRLSKKRHENSEFSYNLTRSRKSATPRSTVSSSSKPAKQKKIAIERDQASSSSNQSTSSSRSTRRSIGSSPSASFSTEGRIERKKKFNAVKKHGHSGGDKGEESEKGNDHPETDGKESDCELYSKNDNDSLDETEDLMKSSTVDFANETPVRNDSPTEKSIDDNFDFDPPSERSHRSEEIEMGEDEYTNSGITGNTAIKTRTFETLPKNKASSSTPMTPKRKADESAGSNSSKRPRAPSDESINPGDMNDNFSHDDPARVELEPFRGPLGLPNEIQEDSDIQQIPNPYPQVMKAIKKEYEEEDQTSLKMVLKSFKSFILGLDTTGLSKLQMELDMKIERTGRGVEVSNKEVIMAIELLIVKLSKHGALKSSEEAISLHDILLMLRMIILNSSFKGLEDILKMLKENIDQLKIMDKKVPVSKVDSVLRATIESIST